MGSDPVLIRLCALALSAIDRSPPRACWRCGDAETGDPNADPCGGGARHEYQDVPVPAHVADARVVLHDALLESGWWDERLYSVRWWTSFATGEEKWRTRERWLRTMDPDPDRINSRAKATAAVLLLGDWPESWPLAAGCLRYRTAIDARFVDVGDDVTSEP